jgi:hypothetical protein
VRLGGGIGIFYIRKKKGAVSWLRTDDRGSRSDGSVEIDRGGAGCNLMHGLLR